MAAFHERLRTLRIENKVMAKDVAALLGITYRNYQHYENGKVEPNISGLITLANFFDVSLDYLIGRTDNPDSHKS